MGKSKETSAISQMEQQRILFRKLSKSPNFRIKHADTPGQKSKIVKKF